MSLASDPLPLTTLRARAHMFRTVREFFASRNVLEVDTPILSPAAPIDAHIDVMAVSLGPSQTGYLHTSPEYCLKRLLSRHKIDIYQLSHVFRNGELSDRHNPEFTMIEWYRVNWSLSDLMQEALDLIRLFLGHSCPVTLYSYQQLFLHYLKIDPFHTSQEELSQLRDSCQAPANSSSWDIDTWLYYHMGFVIEPQMQHLIVVYDFPPTQAALAQIRRRPPFDVAERFEIFYNGIELANGFHELADPSEQRRRLEEANRYRQQLGKTPLPLDEQFLQSLGPDFPDCCGVAVGFDRLFMAQHHLTSLCQAIPFAWKELTASLPSMHGKNI